MFLLFFLLWLLLSGGISVHTCLWGVAVSALITWFCRRVLGYEWRVFCGSPAGIWAMARYFAHLLAEGIEDSSFQQRLERMEAAQWSK